AALGGLESDQVRLVAINEGRLLDFLRHGAGRERFDGLREFVDRAHEDGTGTDSPALLVNLNLRAVTAGGDESLVVQQLAALLKDELWAPCGECGLQLRCPLRHNADTLRDPASGAAVRERIHRLFEVLHLRRRAHVTMRDLRSALAWLLLRDHGCAEVDELLADGGPDTDERLAALSYSEAFADQPAAPRATVADRLVRLLREVDVGRVDDPQLDRRLDYDPESAVPWMTFESRSRYMEEVLQALGNNVPRSVEDAELGTLLAQRRLHLARRRRRAYFERRDEGWQRMLPYRALADLEALVETEAGPKQRQELQDTVIRAISVSEGLRSEAVHRGHLALRVSRVREPSVRSYRLFPKDDFRLEVTGSATVTRYLETAPDAVELVYAREDGRARLRISLDLLEMLELIGRGYRPSPADLRGLFVNLQIFRNELLNLPFRRIVVTRDDQEFYDVTATTGEDGHIGL
ncbi:MAG: hypothetical protein GY856_01670, partial [bacterium]|nr:hypothetical protein [bacterium]